MTRSPWRVARLDLPLEASFDRLLSAAPGVALTVAPSTGNTEAAWAALCRAHAYQVSSAKDELPRPFFVGRELLARCPDLMYVGTYGAGYDTVDVQACTAAGVCVVNQAGSNARAVAEHTIGLLLTLTRKIAACDRALHEGKAAARHAFMGRDLEGMVLGLVGIGHTGRRVAAFAQAFGMRVLAHDPGISDAEVRQRGASPVSLAQLLEASDVVSLHCPRDATTSGMIGAEQFASMKPGAVFISTARGGIHDEDALYHSLLTGRLAGAGLDVWAVEPPPTSHPLLSLPNVVATHHIAGVTREARVEMASMGARHVLEFFVGRRPANLVNPEVWPVVSKRLESCRS